MRHLSARAFQLVHLPIANTYVGRRADRKIVIFPIIVGYLRVEARFSPPVTATVRSMESVLGALSRLYEERHSENNYLGPTRQISTIERHRRLRHSSDARQTCRPEIWIPVEQSFWFDGGPPHSRKQDTDPQDQPVGQEVYFEASPHVVRVKHQRMLARHSHSRERVRSNEIV